jgi:hypothetical protein
MSRQFRVIELDDGGFPAKAMEVFPEEILPVDPVEQLTATVRRIYINLRRYYTNDAEYGKEPIPQYDGGENRWGKNFRPVWPKVAAHIAGLNANPVVYIRRQFHNKKPGEPVVRPNQLYSAAAVARFERYQANIHVNLSSALEFESASIRAEVCVLETGAGKSFIKAIEMALMNTAAVTASPLLRYGMGCEYYLPAVMERWHDEALVQYVFEMAAYDRAWAGWLPASLQQEGRELLSRLLS